MSSEIKRYIFGKLAKAEVARPRIKLYWHLRGEEIPYLGMFMCRESRANLKLVAEVFFAVDLKLKGFMSRLYNRIAARAIEGDELALYENVMRNGYIDDHEIKALENFLIWNYWRGWKNDAAGTHISFTREGLEEKVTDIL